MCGVCSPEDARLVGTAGADAVGMILYAKSPRLIDAEHARAVAAAVPPLASRVGVFVDGRTPFIAQCARSYRLDFIQLHGNETPDHVRALPDFRIIKAVRLSQLKDWASLRLENLEMLLIDAGAGGSGEPHDLDALRQALLDHPPALPFVIAGGLTPDNVGEVVRRFRPWGVDVSSGIESSKAVKDPDKIRQFVAAVREADREF
jgi:phosphoribosylanthranilate isomerase